MAAVAAGCQTSCRRQMTQTSVGWTSPDHRAEVCMRALHCSQSGLKAGKTRDFRGSAQADATLSVSPKAFICNVGKVAARASQDELSTL